MFDELDQQNITPQPLPARAGLPGGIKTPAPAKTEDIFSEVDKTVPPLPVRLPVSGMQTGAQAGKPGPFRPRENNSLPALGTVMPAKTGWLKNKLLVFYLISAGLLVILVGSYFALKLAIKRVATVKKTAVQEEVIDNLPLQAGQAKTETANPAEAQPVQATNTPLKESSEPLKVTQPLDSDHDGLTDEEETKLGTNPSDPDTDHDGLTDREEIKNYGTDPLGADSDGDGYLDGQEVKNGFNPKGQGKLLDINNQKAIK